MKVIIAINGVLQKIAKFLTFIGGIILLVMMFITTYDVILRTFFDSTFQGASVLVRNLLVVAMFLGLPYVTFTMGHTRSEVLYARAADRGKLVLDLIAYGIGMILFILMAYSMIRPTLQSFATSQFDSEGTFIMSLVPFYVLALFGAVFSMYAAIYNFVMLIVKMKKSGKGSDEA